MQQPSIRSRLWLLLLAVPAHALHPVLLHARPLLRASSCAPRCCIRLQDGATLRSVRGAAESVKPEDPSVEGKNLSQRVLDPITRILVPVSLLLLALFSLVLRRLHGWSIVNSLYFAATNRLAVGVGFHGPLSSASRAVFLGLGFFHVALFGGLASAVVGETYKSFDAPTDAHAATKRRLRLALLALLLWLGGAFGLHRLEDPAWAPSLYWSLALLTSANLGELAPVTLGGKLLTAWLSLLGCVAFGRAIGEVATLPLDAAKRKAQEQVLDSWGDELTPATLRKLSQGDLARDLGIVVKGDSCDRNGFALLALVEMGKITAEDLSDCKDAFSRLDRSGKGRLKWDDLALVARDAKREGNEWDEPDPPPGTPPPTAAAPPPTGTTPPGAALARRLAMALERAAGDVSQQAEQAGAQAGNLAAEIAGARAAEARARAAAGGTGGSGAAGAGGEEGAGAGGEAGQGDQAGGEQAAAGVEFVLAPGEKEALAGAECSDDATADDL